MNAKTAKIEFVPTATAWVPVGRDEVSLTHAEILEIAKDWNGYATAKRGGYTYDYMALAKDLHAKYDEQELSFRDLRDIFNWFTDNLYTPWDVRFQTV